MFISDRDGKGTIDPFPSESDSDTESDHREEHEPDVLEIESRSAQSKSTSQKHKSSTPTDTKSEPPRKRSRKYAKKWSEDPKLACFSSYEGDREEFKDKAFCNVCSKRIEGTISHLQRHLKTQYHIKRSKSVKSASVPALFTKKKQPSRDAERFRLMLLKFLCEHNISFNVMDHLMLVLKNGARDSQIIKNLKSGRQISRDIVVKCIGNESLKEIVEILKANKYSIMVDESTDVSTTKLLAIVVRVVNKEKGTVDDRFLQLLDVEDSSAEGLFQLLSNFFEANGIPFANMIGFAADNASVMMGSMGDLKAKLLNEVPHLFVIGCICHSLHLCSSAACLKLPKSVEELCRDIHSYINHSPKRLLKFQEFQQFVRADSHRILYASQTRWLSLESVVNRIMEQWSSLLLFFQAEALDTKVRGAAEILDALNNPLFKLYFSFLSYILPIINKMNKEFQSETVMIHIAYSNICDFYRTILGNYIKMDVLSKEVNPFAIAFQDPGNFLPEEEWYFGSKVENMMKNRNVVDQLGSEVNSFRVKCLNFYIELSGQICKRFRGLNDVFPLLKACDPDVVKRNEVKSLVPLFKKFPQLVEEADYDEWNDEWRSLPYHRNSLSDSQNPSEFWCSVKKIKSSDGTPMFQNIANFMMNLLVLPHSSAAVERIFSQVKLIKTDIRNRLNTESINGLLLSKGNGGSINCYEWEPSNCMIKSAQHLSEKK